MMQALVRALVHALVEALISESPGASLDGCKPCLKPECGNVRNHSVDRVMVVMFAIQSRQAGLASHGLRRRPGHAIYVKPLFNSKKNPERMCITR